MPAFAIKCIVISNGIFRVLLFKKYFLGFSVSGKVFFGVVPKYSTLRILFCRFVKSTPWANSSRAERFSGSPVPDGSDTKLFSEKVNSSRAEKVPISSKPESLFTGERSQIADDSGRKLTVKGSNSSLSC